MSRLGSWYNVQSSDHDFGQGHRVGLETHNIWEAASRPDCLSGKTSVVCVLVLCVTRAAISLAKFFTHPLPFLPYCFKNIKK